MGLCVSVSQVAWMCVYMSCGLHHVVMWWQALPRAAGGKRGGALRYAAGASWRLDT